VFISTYPPRECGIATFTSDLLSALQKIFGSSARCLVAAINLSALDTYEYPLEVEWQIDQNSKTEYLALARKLNKNPDVVTTILQHEYGIFGGEEGENILSFINAYKKTLVVTLHTIIPVPSVKMKVVTEAILKRADKIVVLTESSKNKIEELYPDSVGKIKVIPHGIHNTAFSGTTKFKRRLKLDNTKVISTFGLLSRGKGIEYMIAALPAVVKQFPDIRYLILGETHPVVRRAEGEKYRLELLSMVAKLHLKKHVKFYDQYLELPDLLNFLKATDIYISTSINPEQAVSGTLSYALGAGRAVISTDFVQAKELISNNVGRTVPIKNSAVFSEEIISLLKNPSRLTKMHRYAYEVTRPMLWNNVALEFSKVILELHPDTLLDDALPKINLGHLHHMTDDCGLFQFADFRKPNKSFGYTLDDNARALVVACSLYENQPQNESLLFIEKYLYFIRRCQKSDGNFVNYVSYNEKQATIQNLEEDIEESYSRALWGVCSTISTSNLPDNLREIAMGILNNALPHAYKLTHARTRALTIKSLSLAYSSRKNKKELLDIIKIHAESLAESFKENKSISWDWFANYLGYNNAILPESLFIAGAILNNKKYTTIAQQTLVFLISKTFNEKMYVPIGNQAWHRQNETRSEFDQQPEDPTSMILALATAFEMTQNKEYQKLANLCFSWFLGNNALKIPVYNSSNGGCFDGLHPDRVNLNQGAESLVSYLLARIEVGRLAYNV
jgi:glycosyltransferase involved in cell wall biosynthesis